MDESIAVNISLDLLKEDWIEVVMVALDGDSPTNDDIIPPLDRQKMNTIWHFVGWIGDIGVKLQKFNDVQKLIV